jgi:hypothetical protein
MGEDAMMQALARVEEVKQQFADFTDEQIPYIAVVLELSTSARYLNDAAKLGWTPEQLMEASARLNDVALLSRPRA